MPTPVQSLEFQVDGPGRLDACLRELEAPELAYFSRATWKKLFEIGGVRTEAGKKRKPGETVTETSLVRLLFPAELVPFSSGEGTDAAEIVYLEADAKWGAFLKPAGVPTYPLLPWETGTFVEQVAAQVVESRLASRESFFTLGPAPSLEGGLVQRLDNGTSGIVLAAWDNGAKEKLRELFRQHEVVKTYLALVEGEAVEDFSEQEFLLYQETPARMSLEYSDRGEPQPVVCSVRTLAREKNAALIEFVTNAGVRHQVRAIMASLGAPLIGDTVYGEASATTPHHLLHAASVKLPKTVGGKKISAPPPEAFLAEAARLGLYWTGE